VPVAKFTWKRMNIYMIKSLIHLHPNSFLKRQGAAPFILGGTLVDNPSVVDIRLVATNTEMMMATPSAIKCEVIPWLKAQ
jgi:hypothetical protein